MVRPLLEWTAPPAVITSAPVWPAKGLGRLTDRRPSPGSAPATASARQARAATAELAKYSAMDAYTKALDNGGRQAVDAAVKAAQAGNNATVQSFAQNSCGGPFYGRAKPAGH